MRIALLALALTLASCTEPKAPSDAAHADAIATLEAEAETLRDEVDGLSRRLQNLERQHTELSDSVIANNRTQENRDRDQDRAISDIERQARYPSRY